MNKNQWHVGKPGFVFIYGPQGEEIAQVSSFQFTDAEARALAAQIVREHNAHDELVAALLMICDSGVALAEPIEKAMLAVLAKAGAL